MKKIILLILVMCFSVMSASTKHIQNAKAATGGDIFTKIAYTSDVTSGNLLVVALSWAVNAGANTGIDSVKDKFGAKFVLASGSYATRAGSGFAYVRSQIMYVNASSSGSDTVMVYFSDANAGSQIAIYELTPGSLDQSANGTGSSAAPSAGTITTITDSSTAISMGMQTNGFGFASGWFSQGIDWVFALEQGGGNRNAVSKYLFKTPAGTALDTVTPKYPGISAPWAASMCTFKPESSGPSFGPSFGYSGGGLRDTVGDLDTIDLTVTGTFDSIHIIAAPTGSTKRSDTVFLPRNYVYTMNSSFSVYSGGNSYDTVTIADTTVWDTIKISALIKPTGTYTKWDNIYVGNTIGIKVSSGLRNAKSIVTPSGLDSVALTDTCMWVTVNDSIGTNGDSIVLSLSDSVFTSYSVDTLIFSAFRTIYDTLNIVSYFNQIDTITCNNLIVQTTDSSIFNYPIYVRDSVVYNINSLPVARYGSSIISISPYPLVIKLNGKRNTPAVRNRSIIRWR